MKQIMAGKHFEPARRIMLFTACMLILSLERAVCRGNVQTPSPSSLVLVIQEQGSFTAGGTVSNSGVEFDALNHWTSGGQTLHGDHASVSYQIPENAKGLPLLFLHGAGQSSRSWETTADGREGFANIFLRQGFNVYLESVYKVKKSGWERQNSFCNILQKK